MHNTPTHPATLKQISQVKLTIIIMNQWNLREKKCCVSAWFRNFQIADSSTATLAKYCKISDTHPHPNFVFETLISEKVCVQSCIEFGGKAENSQKNWKLTLKKGKTAKNSCNFEHFRLMLLWHFWQNLHPFTATFEHTCQNISFWPPLIWGKKEFFKIIFFQPLFY